MDDKMQLKTLRILLLVYTYLIASAIAQDDCNRNIDIIFAVDASGSIKDQDPGNWDRLLNFVRDIARNMAASGNNRLRFGLVKFSDTATPDIHLGSYRDIATFTNAVSQVAYVGGYTNQADAFRKSEQMFTSAGGSNNERVIIMITDGMATVENNLEVTLARQLRDDRAVIIAVGVTSNINNEKLLDLAGNQRYVFQAPDFRDSLSSQVMNVIRAAGGCVTPTYAPPVDCGGPPEVVLALDSSGSINDAATNNFQRLLEFAISIAQDVAQRRPNARFALISFSTNAKIESRLSGFGDVNQFAGLVRSTKFVGDYTNHADALRKSRDVLREARTPSSRFVIMVTDGTSTQEIGDEINEAAVTRSQGTKIILVGVTNMINEANLIKMSGDPSTVFKSPDFRSLPGQISNVVQATAVCPTQVPTTPGPVPCDGSNIVFLVDASGSILEKGPNNWELMKTFVADLARGLSIYPNIRFGLVRFSSDADIIRYLSDYRSFAEFENVVRTMPYVGSYTNLADGLRKSRDVITRDSTFYPQVVVITDGIPTREQGVEVQEARIIKNMGGRIIAIGVTSDINRSVLETITGNARYTFQSPSFQSLSAQVIPVISTACSSDIIPTPAPGQSSCSTNPDIVFVVDSSGSILETDPTNWDRVRTMLVQSAQTFYQSFPSVRFGLVLFSTNGRVIFTLTDFNEITQVYDAFRALPYIGDRTNIAEGISLAREQVFLRATRPGVTRIMVVITDGVSNERVGQEIQEASLAKAANPPIRIVTVAVTDKVDFPTLRQVASDAANGVIGTPNFQSLSNVVQPLIRAACLNNDLPPCGKLDLALLVDSSGSIRETGDNWPLVTTALERIIDAVASKMSIGPSGAYVAIVLFSETAEIVLPLTSDRQVLLNAIRNLKFLGATTNLAAAMFRTRVDIFNGADRSDAPNVAVVISDGKPNEPRDTVQGLTDARYEAMRLHQVTSAVAVMGVTRFIDEELLRDRIASKPSLYTKVQDFQELQDSAKNIVNNVCR